MQITIDAYDVGSRPIKLSFDDCGEFVTITLPDTDELIYIRKIEWAMLLEAGSALLIERIDDA